MRTRLWPVFLSVMLLSLGLSAGRVEAGSLPGPEEPVGPIVGTLNPPVTHYYVEDAYSDDEFYYEVYWDETTAGDPSPAELWGHDPEPFSCGTFLPNTDESGPPTRGTGVGLYYSENSALWSHPNGSGAGFCPHVQGTDHPGLVIADVWEGYNPPPPITGPTRVRPTGEPDYYYESLPDAIYHCEFEGSETGVGDPCVLIATPSSDYCRYHLGEVAVTAITSLLIRSSGDQVVFSDESGPVCSVSAEDVKRITVLGGGGDDHVEIDRLVLSLAKIGLNLKGGANTLSLTGSDGVDWFGLHGIAPATGFPGGLALDFDKDDRPDLSALGIRYLNVNLGAGNDTAKVFPEYLYSQFGSYSWNVNGGRGTDRAMLLPSKAGRYTFGTDGSVQPPAAMVNLDSDNGDTVEVMGVNVEKWFATGTEMADVFSGAGGDGTGTTFRFPLNLSGLGGNDKLTGGAKSDTLNGGAGSGDVCKGGKGTDTATGCETKKSIP